MRKFYILWASIGVLMFSGCTAKHYSISEPKMIVFKTPKIKYADMGYLRYEGNAVEVELFTAGVSVEKISIDDQVCVSAGCMDEEKFVHEYLNPFYPKDTLRKILQNEPIFDGNGTSESCGGVKFQTIRNEEIDVLYRRSNGAVLFKDRLNGLMIKINDVEENNATQ